MLCTKSPNRLRYADSFDGPILALAGSEGAGEVSVFSVFLARKPFCEIEESTPDALAVVGSTLCEWE